MILRSEGPLIKKSIPSEHVVSIPAINFISVAAELRSFYVLGAAGRECRRYRVVESTSWTKFADAIAAVVCAHVLILKS